MSDEREPLDPKPWYVVEADDQEYGSNDGRYTVEEYRESARYSEHGGIVSNLAVFKPRPGYSQRREDYEHDETPITDQRGVGRCDLMTDQPAHEALPDEPEDDLDPRWVYEMTKEQAYRAWPCLECRMRRDEHADQNLPHRFSALDITDHAFKGEPMSDQQHDHDDDVIGPGHPMYEAMMLTMDGNVVTGRRYDDGTVEITSVTPDTRAVPASGVTPAQHRAPRRRRERRHRVPRWASIPAAVLIAAAFILLHVVVAPFLAEGGERLVVGMLIGAVGGIAMMVAYRWMDER